jgi:hypothetical protein
MTVPLLGIGWQFARVTAASSPQGAAVPEAIPSPPAAAADAAKHYVGSGSCAARACHGNPTITRRGESNSAYVIWLSSDPHAQAYAVLSTPEAQHMAEALGLGAATKADRCLACHSLSIGGAHPAAAAGVNPAALLADGVGCEACHGPAEKYLAEHTLNRWHRPGDPKFDPSFGMTDTANIGPRAAICAGCHVGQPDAEGRPWRDVNHDLIAAGHPRLNFEFSAYMANLPPHWNVNRDPERFEELHSWIAGQLASGEAALKLLESRASSAATLPKAGERTLVPGVWPELSEYDCYSCHHDLRGNGWRQSYHSSIAADERTANPPAPPRGSPGWGTWYFQGPRLLAATSAVMPKPSGSDWLESLNGLAATMQTALPNASTARQETESCSAKLAASSSAIGQLFASSTPADQAALRKEVLRSLDSQFQRRRPRDWDEFVQYYLALVAIDRSQAKGSSARAAELLEAIRNRLSFPRTSAASESATVSSPSLRVVNPGYSSPLDFDPNAKQADASPDAPAGKSLFELFDEVFRILTAAESSSQSLPARQSNSRRS